GQNPYEVMRDYGQKLSQEFPDIQKDIDQFLYDSIDVKSDMYIEDFGINVPAMLSSMAVKFIGNMIIPRVEDVKPQLPQDYVSELDGVASTLANSDTDEVGDGFLSKNELYFFNLLADIGRTVQCSAISVFGSLSETGSPMVARSLDMPANLANYHCVTKINKGESSVYLIGWLASMNALTAFNSAGVFAAIVDTIGAEQHYSSSGIYSYPFDLRYALENESVIEGVAGYMSQHPYGFNHLIFLADSEKSGVLENNLSGTGNDMRRALRSSDSELNPGIEWDFSNAIAAVSGFMLKGNHDNFTQVEICTTRLDSYKRLLTEAESDGKVTWNELKNIQSYDGTDGIPGLLEDGDLYNSETAQIILFQPKTLELEIFFRNTPTPPNEPSPFDKITIPFQK
ncbi:MAG: hypothetical protein J7L90_00620, partial [Dehalococcoidia bacterium]|nr:hypothetical protein [Dehalococcoidia bacterium]